MAKEVNLVLIYKNKGNREEMVNYRSLMMTNVDYKIVANGMKVLKEFKY